MLKKKEITNTTRLLRTLLLSILLVFTIFPLAACGKTVKTASSLELIQQNDSMSISLNVTSTFNNRSSTVTIPSEYAVADVPVIWSGLMFSGGTYEDAEGNISSSITGFLSPDGTWIESMTYSKTIVGKSMMGITFEVKLRNIPIFDPAAGQLLNFEKTADVEKYVTSIKYSQLGITYVSTDWDNITGGQPPVLKLKLEKGDPNKPRRTPPSGGM
jgi:hypothetical protein